MCSKLEDVQLASSSISFGYIPFCGCNRLIELAAAAGFPSNTFGNHPDFGRVKFGAGVVPYLNDRFENYERRIPVLLAYLRFSDAVHTSRGSEVRKFEKARSAYATKFVGGVLQCGLIGGGPKGVLGVILSYV